MAVDTSDLGRRLLALGAAAAHLGIKSRDLRRAADAGLVPCVRLGSSLLFDIERLRCVLVEQASRASGTVGAAPGCESAGGQP